MVPSLTLEYTEAGNLDDRMDAVKRAGFNCVNIYSGICKHLMQSVLSETKILKSQLKHHGLAADWLHAPYVYPVLYEMDIEKFSVSVGALKTAVNIAAELGVRSLVVHPFGLDFPKDVDRGDAVDQLLHAFSVLVDYSHRYGVYIAVENIDEPYSKRLLQELFEKVPGLMFCFDTGHANMWCTWEQYIPRYLNKISALHIHDNHGKADEHLLPGDGVIDFISFFKMLKAHDYNGCIGLECVQRIGNYPGGHLDLAETIFQRITQMLAKAA